MFFLRFLYNLWEGKTMKDFVNDKYTVVQIRFNVFLEPKILFSL